MRAALQNLHAAEADVAAAEVARLHAEEARRRADVAFDAQVSVARTAQMMCVRSKGAMSTQGCAHIQRSLSNWFASKSVLAHLQHFISTKCVHGCGFHCIGTSVSAWPCTP